MSGPERLWPRRGRSGLEAERARRREVEACLERWRLVSRPRAFGGGAEIEEETLGRRLLGALGDLGPVGAAFGRYLASRVDLLPARDCLELARLPAWVEPLPAAAVAERIAAELGGRAEDGGRAEELLAGLEPVPFESTLLLQSHRTRLPKGQPAIVRVVRPEIHLGTQPGGWDLSLLPALAAALAAYGIPFDQAAADFRLDLEQSSDLRSAASTLEMLAVDAETFGRLAAPAVDRGLTTARLLTHADLGGAAPGDPLWPGGPPGVDPVGDAAATAQQVAVVWFRQALFGRVFPQELGAGAVRVLPGRRIGLQGLSFVRVPAAVQASLRAFVIAVASHDPDAACAALLPEMVREEGATSEEELLLQLRQIVPFRDGAWSASGQSLAEHAFVYARVARACGDRASLPALAFQRGLFAVARACRELTPDGDPLTDGLQELRLLTGFSQMNNAIRPDQWSGQLDRYALLMATLPQRIDELLARAADGDVRLTAPPEPPRQRPAGSPQVLSAAVALVAAALALLLHHLVEVGVLAGKGEKVTAILFLIGGGFLLWVLGRRGAA